MDLKNHINEELLPPPVPIHATDSYFECTSDLPEDAWSGELEENKMKKCVDSKSAPNSNHWAIIMFNTMSVSGWDANDPPEQENISVYVWDIKICNKES